MLGYVNAALGATDGSALLDLLVGLKNYVLIFAGFSLVIFFHELGHFIAAKSCGVRVEKFAIGFGRELFGWTKGETRYAFNILPLGGYVRMMGQEDFTVDKTGELRVKSDPRAFSNKPVGQRMLIVSSGVFMNLFFAAAVFMIVFLVGVKFPSAVVGMVKPESAADRAGIRIGDRILEINGQTVSDFNDVRPAILLASPTEPSTIKIERPNPAGGEPSILSLQATPQTARDANELQFGVSPPFSNRVTLVDADPDLPADQQVVSGDVVESINGQKVGGLVEISEALAKLKGQFGDVLVLRTDKAGKEQQVHVKRRARLVFGPTGDPNREAGHLLGLVPRREVSRITPGERAEKAGIRPGDVIIKWGSHTSPTLTEVLDSIRDNGDREIPVTVLHPSADGNATTQSMQVTPKSQGHFGSGRPKVGMDPYAQEEDRLVVADIIPEFTAIDQKVATPVAALKDKMPRGALITKVDGQPVKTWSQLSEYFLHAAGKDVKLSWTYEGQPEQTASIHVPATLGDIYPLPPPQFITKINGLTMVEVMVNNRPALYTAGSWLGAREILKKCVGQTVTVEYRGPLDPTASKVEVKVTPDMLDTWGQRVQYHVFDERAQALITDLVVTEIRVANPLKASMIGLRKTFFFVEQVYLMGQRMIFDRSMGFDQMSGPVGIVKMGSEIAGDDFVKLLYFLALISANLAVINFLPMPIVDGGLFVFLLIEKIKGSPISLRVQVATQVVGFMLIIGMFLFVTIQDISKMFG
jgi:regulator of sigma E protease